MSCAPWTRMYSLLWETDINLILILIKAITDKDTETRNMILWVWKTKELDLVLGVKGEFLWGYND